MAKGDKAEGLQVVSSSSPSSPGDVEFITVVVKRLCLLSTAQKRKAAALLDARMAKIYRRQRHSREGDSASDDDDEGLDIKGPLDLSRCLTIKG